MFDFHQRRKLRKVINSRYTQAALVILFFLMSWSAYTRYEIAREMVDRRVEIEEVVTELRAEKDLLEAEVEYLSGERGIEAELRRQFDVALPGEQVVVIVNEAESDEEKILPLSTSTPPQKKWYQFWQD